MEEASFNLTVKLLKHLVPYIRQEFVADIEKGRGFLNLPPKFFPLLSTTIWANLYEDRKKVKGILPAFFLRLMSDEERAEILALSHEEKVVFGSALKVLAIVDFEAGETPFGFSSFPLPPLEEAQAELAKLTDEERKEAELNVKILTCFFMTHVCTFLALMSFGQTMCDLVAKAKAGDDDAFCKAVQVDRTVLFGIPYFQQRLIRAQAGYEPGFLNSLANAIKAPPLSQKLRYPLLMIVFYVLDDEGLLDISLDRLFDLCQEVGVYGPEFGVEDVESLRKRRSYYRKMTGRQIRF